MDTIRVAVVSTDGAKALDQAVRKSTRGALVASTQDDCASPHSPGIQTLQKVTPEVVIIGTPHARVQLLGTLKALRGALPEARLFVELSGSDMHLVIEAMRAGAGEFLESPVSASDLDEAFDRYLNDSRKPGQIHTRGSLYSIISGKLSSGATTMAINVANSIATATDASTLLIDLDIPLGDAAAYLNLRPQYTVQDALNAASRLDPMLLENFTVKVKNTTLNVLGGFRDYTARTAVSPASLEAVLRVSRDTFRYTVVDLSGSIDSDQAVVVARQSEQILIALTPDLPAIWRTEKLLSFLAQHGADENVKLILNRTSRRDDIGERDIERLLSQPVYHALPNDYGACLKAINSGRPLEQEDSRSLHDAIEELALEIAGIQDRKDSKGLLGMFLRPSSIGG
jgi:pilus assembly protein CpaE